MFLKIRQERKKNGWTLDFVARQIGISKAAYRNIETGQRKPSYAILVKLLGVFNYNDPRELFGAATPDNTKEPDGNQAGTKTI